MRSLVALLLLVVTANAAAPNRIRVLIVDGCSNHDWRVTTRSIRAILEPTGLFDVTVSTAPPSAAAPGWDTWRPKFRDYDAVIQTYNDLGGGAKWPEEVKTAFEAYVRSGGGAYIWHAGNNAFADWPAYNQIIGLGWRKNDQGVAVEVGSDEKIIRHPPGEGPNTSHGARFDATIVRLDDHPIHAGLPRKWKAANIEVYSYGRGPAENLTVLSYAHDESKTKLNWPVEWTVAYGEGRVYVSSFGHVWNDMIQPATMRDAGVQTIAVRALQWLARRPVDYPVPPDFPTENATSVRGELRLPTN